MTISPMYSAARSPATLDSLDTTIVGSWTLTGHHPKTGKAVDLTQFRGEPTQIGTFGFSDPFGAKDMTLTFPEITIFDGVGHSDLSWIAKGASIELIWNGPMPSGYPFGLPIFETFMMENDTLPTPYVSGWKPAFRWEGYVVSFDIDTSAGLTLNCTGAMYQLDLYEAKPEYPPRPMPYEYAITRQFRNKPHLRLKHLKTAWPESWTKQYTHPGPSTPSYMVPIGVRAPGPWTGLLTRSTGNWEAALTSYIQTILASMYTDSGRWTLDLVQGRQPLLLHRPMRTVPSTDTVMVDPTAPGNLVSLSQDWTQSLDVVFAQGTGLDGVAYSGMEVTSDGSQTFYEPYAFRRQAFPTSNNKWLDTTTMPTEVMIQVQQGVDAAGAQQVAASHLRSFADPGLTGQITLACDPIMNGQPFLRYLVRAGMDIAVPGLLGRPESTLLHVTDNTCDLVAGTNTLTVDSKFRDALTVQEVKARGRDSLKVARMLVGGQYTPPVPDQLVPWNYAKGSGFIPSGKKQNCVELFNGMPDSVLFPWTPWTTQRPPSSHHWRNSYIHIGPPGAHADDNWAYRSGGPNNPSGISGHFGITIRAAQSATIRLLQVAAYHADGTVMKVPFHISFYTSRGVNVGSMPLISDTDIANGSNDGHSLTTQHYPFTSSAWETYNSAGELQNPQVPVATQGSGLIKAFGTRYEQAGMFPGTGTTLSGGSPVAVPSSTGPTGLLVDESQWAIDTTQQGNNFFNPYSKKQDQQPLTGLIYCMIYCEAQVKDVYFLGRLFRVEPGTGS